MGFFCFDLLNIKTPPSDSPLSKGGKSTLRLPGINAWACSGLTLSGASYPALKGGLGAAEWVKYTKNGFACQDIGNL
jgi:hypothetical protein